MERGAAWAGTITEPGRTAAGWLCQQSLVLVHVSVRLVPRVLRVGHRHLGGGGERHHGGRLDVLLHVGGEVGGRPLGDGWGAGVVGAAHVWVRRHVPVVGPAPRPATRGGRGVVGGAGRGEVSGVMGRGRVAALPHRRRVLGRGGGSLAATHPNRRPFRAGRGRGAARQRLPHPQAGVALPRLHQLLVLGPPVLEPDFHLKQKMISKQLSDSRQACVYFPLYTVQCYL